MALSENIQRIAKEQGISVYRIAKDGDVSQSYMSDIANGKCKNPSLTVLTKISKVLNCKIEELIN
jgi:XRE family transcriptional regulator of biofilm formation